MDMTRQTFCRALGAGVALLAAGGCGGGGDSAPAPGPAPAAGCGSSGAGISGNHGHTLTVARADLDSTTALTYSIAGSAGHDHSIVLSPANLAALKAGGTVTVSSSVTDHGHSVTVSCS